MKKITLLCIATIALLNCRRKEPDLICERINYLMEVKNEVAKNHWPDFNRNVLFSPMLYYTQSGLITIDANERLKKRIDIEFYNCDDCKVSLGFSKIVDTTNFYMNVSYDGKDSTLLYYKNTLGMFSDVNLTEKFIPEVKDTQEWMSMVIHEMFHQYQRSFEKFWETQVSSQKDLDRDTLDYLFKNKDWFSNSVNSENNILLEILAEPNADSIKTYISAYLNAKEQRFLKVRDELRLEIAELENSLSQSEGTARYIEYCAKLALKDLPDNQTLAQIDNKYKTHRFRQYHVHQDEWMYNLGGGYYYSIGFNMTRVLEKLKIDYQNDIFLNNKHFDLYLSEYIK